MIRPALLAATAFAAGYLTRSELQRRRRPSPSGADRLAAAVTADRGSAWLWAGLRKIIDGAEPGSAALSLTVFTRSPDGGVNAGRVMRGEDSPTWSLAVRDRDGQPQLIDVPDDASGIGGAA